MPRQGTWTADRGISARPRPKTVIGHAERVSRGLPKLPTMADAKSAYMSTFNTNAMSAKRAMYFQQRCPYDTVPKRIPGCNARRGMGAALQHAQIEFSQDTWPITIPFNKPSQDWLRPSSEAVSQTSSLVDGAAPSSSKGLAYPSDKWTVRMDKSGRQYYVNKFDKRISWTFPNPADEADPDRSNPKGKEQMYIDVLEDRILQRASSDMLAVPEATKKEIPDPFRDALLNKPVRREERGVMLENAAGATIMALVEGGRDASLSGAAPSGARHPGIHQSISRGLSGPTRVPRNLSRANIVTHTRDMGTYSLLRHGCKDSRSGRRDTMPQEVEQAQIEVFDSRPNTTEPVHIVQDSKEKEASEAQESTTSLSHRRTGTKHCISTMETLGGLPTFNALAYKKVPPQQKLCDINAKSIILNYPEADLTKSEKGILAPQLTRSKDWQFPDPNFVKTRAGTTDSKDWSRPITALTRFGIVYPDGTIGPSNPVNPAFDQLRYEEELTMRQAEVQNLDVENVQRELDDRLHRKNFTEWILKTEDRLAKKPPSMVAATTLSLPSIDLKFKDQLEIIHTMHKDRQLRTPVFRLLKQLILNAEYTTAIKTNTRSSLRSVRKKGGYWPEEDSVRFRDASSPDMAPFAKSPCEYPEDEYTTTIKTFDSTVSGHDMQAMRDQQPAGRATPGGHSGGEAFGNISTCVNNLEEALTRRTRRPVTSVYLPKRMSEISICHYDPFHGHEKYKEVGLLDPASPDRLTVSPKEPKMLGVDSVFFDSTRYAQAKDLPKVSEVQSKIMFPFEKSNWMTMTTQRRMMPKDDLTSQYVRTPAPNMH